MRAARLYGPRDLRVEDVPDLGEPGVGHVKIAVTAVGICGSDLHSYMDGRIGDTVAENPLVLGHEFAGTVIAVGPDALDGEGEPLRVGQRVAVDPATPCWRCEMCEAGHPNLCRRLHFCGLYPDDGSLREQMIVESRGCFVMPDSVTDVEAALLEPLGVALHAVDLAKLKVAKSVAVIGCGTIGLMIMRLARMSGSKPIYAFDKLDWRTKEACNWGATQSWTVSEPNESVRILNEATNGRGVDVVFEAAWADQTVGEAVEMARLGGRVMLVGIPSDDRMTLKHSTARRKGLTLVMSRRMKHTYPRSLKLISTTPEPLELEKLVTHRFTLEQSPEAFALNLDYKEQIVKAVITIN